MPYSIIPQSHSISSFVKVRIFLDILHRPIYIHHKLG